MRLEKRLTNTARSALEYANSSRNPQLHDITEALTQKCVRTTRELVGDRATSIMRGQIAAVNSGGKMLKVIDRVAELAVIEAMNAREAKASPEHLFLAMYDINPQPFDEVGITRQVLLNAILADRPPIEDEEIPPSPLELFCVDMLDQATKIDPVVGREQEIARIIQVLARRTKNNPALIGFPGIGKSAIAYGIAQRLVADDVPDRIKGWPMFELDISLILAGTGVAGSLEERVYALLAEIRSFETPVIMFVDEMHRLSGAGGNGSQDLANMLKPALARGELHMVGATTLDEYRNFIEKDGALERRFQPVYIDEPSEEQTLAIIEGIQQYYGAFHGVSILATARELAVKLAGRYVTQRYFPDKAIDVLDEASAKKSIAGGKRVTDNDVADVISMWTGVPVSKLTRDEQERMQGIEDAIHSRLIGQEEAVTAVCNAVRRSRAGFSAKGRPIGSFMFLGPTGVGKTELAKTLAWYLFDDPNAVLRLDMSEYRERHTTAKLFGSPPGYVGYGEGGHLTEPVRRRPYQVVLLDEIEKAHANVHNALLQVLDDGRMTDGSGHIVNFQNTVIIMTSNALPELWQQRHVTRRDMERGLGELFRPEFINRLDDLIRFTYLDENEILQIADIKLKEVQLMAEDAGYDVQFDDAVKEHLARIGYHPEFGARPLNRAIQSEIIDQLTFHVTSGNAQPKVSFIMVDDTVTIKEA